MVQEFASLQTHYGGYSYLVTINDGSLWERVYFSCFPVCSAVLLFHMSQYFFYLSTVMRLIVTPVSDILLYSIFVDHTFKDTSNTRAGSIWLRGAYSWLRGAHGWLRGAYGWLRGAYGLGQHMA